MDGRGEVYIVIYFFKNAGGGIKNEQPNQIKRERTKLSKCCFKVDHIIIRHHENIDKNTRVLLKYFCAKKQ